MITKTVIKDYVAKRCPYLVSLELEDKTLINLLKKSITNQEKYRELAEEESDNDTDGDDTFDLYETLKDYPYLKKEIEAYEKTIHKNPAEELIDKYNDNQLISKLSREYYEDLYGVDHCGRCDIDQDGNELLDQKEILGYTFRYINDPNIKVIFEGQVEVDGLRARFDILLKNEDDTYELIEVKGTNDVFVHPSKDGCKDYDEDTRIKDKYLYDLLFQYYVYEKAGYHIKELGFMFTNRDFELGVLSYPVDRKELYKLFVIKREINLKEETIPLKQYFDEHLYINIPRSKNLNPTIEDILDDIDRISNDKDVYPKMKYECRKSPRCELIDMCFKDADSPNSILRLTNWNLYGGYFGKTRDLISSGITKISDIDPNPFPELKKNGDHCSAYLQVEYQKNNIKEKYVICRRLIKEIIERDYYNDDIDYLLFFDFESFQYPIPLVEHSHPWKQIVSQYSMHVVDKKYDLTKHDFAKGIGGGVKHYEFIANPDITKYENPSIELYKTLKQQLIEFGIDPYASNYRVVVFNQNFEKTRMNEFSKDFAELCDNDLIRFVDNFNNNVVDLLDFFTSGSIYCVDFNGRGSLKVVQPTLAADSDVLDFYNKKLPFDLTYSLDYHKGDKCLVYNGGICLDLYKSLLVRSHLNESNIGPSTQDLLDEALAYCKIDSWGTVIIYDIIKNIYLGNLKIDAKEE